MDPSRKITEGCFGEYGSYRVLGIFDWKVKGVEVLVQNRTPEEDRGKYMVQNMMGIKDDRFKKNNNIEVSHLNLYVGSLR